MHKRGFCVRMEEEWVLEESGMWTVTIKPFLKSHFLKHTLPLLLMANQPSLSFSSGSPVHASLKRVGTHNGSFHCDEALGCFMIRLTHKFNNAEIVRSRDPLVGFMSSHFFFVVFCLVAEKYDVFCFVDEEMWYFGGWFVKNLFFFHLVWGNMTFYFWLIRKCSFSGWVEVWLMEKYDFSPLGDCIFFMFLLVSEKLELGFWLMTEFVSFFKGEIWVMKKTWLFAEIYIDKNQVINQPTLKS